MNKMGKSKIGPALILIGLIVAFLLGGTSFLAFAPWWVWTVILFIIIFKFTGGKK